MEDKVKLDFLTIRERIKTLKLPQVDHVIGIGSGGVVPASLIAFELGAPLTILSINYRAPNNIPRFDKPQLLADFSLPDLQKRLLLVDDVSVSGKTLSLALSLLEGYKVETLVMKGNADIVCFPEIRSCVNWPWH